MVENMYAENVAVGATEVPASVPNGVFMPHQQGYYLFAV